MNEVIFGIHLNLVVLAWRQRLLFPVRNVKRNIERFPTHFMFQLTSEEYERLRSQLGISKLGRGGRRYLPYAFTEQGVARLSSVLHSKRAIKVNIAMMDTFVRLR